MPSASRRTSTVLPSSTESADTPRPGHPALPWLAALAVMLMWASSFLVIRAGGAHFSPGALSLLRLAAAALALAPLVLHRRVRLPRSGRLWTAVIAWGVAWFAAYTVALNAAEQTIDAATAAMRVNLAPLIVAVVSGVLFGEGLPLRLLGGVLVALAGIGLITVATSTGDVSAAGLVLGLFAALLYAGSVLAQKSLLTQIDSTSMTVVGILGGLAACLPFSAQLAQELAWAPIGSVISVVYLGVFPTAVAFLLWGFALSRMPAGVLTSSSLVVPAITLGAAWLVLGEVPPPLAALGGVLCLVGAGTAIAPNVLRALRAPRPGGAPSGAGEPAPEAAPPSRGNAD